MSVPNGTRSQKKPHVGIVGAGISGLRCADVLLTHGFDVTILEARNRIGGRICQSDELGYTVDISGPNWIHAWTDSDVPHPIYKLAGDSKTPLHHWNNKQLIFDSKGEKVSNERSERLSTVLWEIIEKAFVFSEAAHWKDGDEMFVESNYSGILKLAANPALDGAKMLLSTKVTGVSTPQVRIPGQKVSLATEAGEVYHFDEVVMTTPLGWLKKNLRVFSPPLPKSISSAIASISLSQLEKVFITFPSVFWTEDSSQDKFPCYINWLAPEYAKDTNSACWPQEIWDLSTFAPPNNHPAILFYLYGDCSRYIVNMIYGKSKEEKHKLLDDFFRPYYSRLPGYHAGNENCVPKAILATEWLKDELNGFGSYCNFQVGIEAADKDLLAIKNGCEERRLWFCGEHAAPFEECGTVAGAYLSGEDLGKRIAGLY